MERSIKMIKAALPKAKMSKNKTEEKMINLRCMELWYFRETGMENMLLYAIYIYINRLPCFPLEPPMV
jgi:hypothetical protein